MEGRIMMGRTAAFMVTILVAVSLMACEVNPYEGPEGATRVVVVGDSITFMSGGYTRDLMGDYQTSITGVLGIGQVEGRGRLVQPGVAMQPDVMVIELGINSARESWDAADIPHLEGIMDDASSVPCVIYVTPSALEPSEYDSNGIGSMQDRLASMRGSIARRVAKRPNFHLADWGAVSRTQPSWFESDGLHNSVAGRKAYAAYVNEQVRTLCPGGPS
jgi:hypothetical protein